MRILHVTDGFRPRLGGIEVFVEDLASRQARAGHDVTVLTTTPDAPEGSPDPVPGDGVRVVRTPRSARHPLLPPAARRASLAGAYDVVHAHLSVLSPFASLVGRTADEAGIATVNTVHSMWASRPVTVRTARLVADWDRSRVVWTAVSEAAAVEARSALQLGTPVKVVPNAVDVDWWRTGPVLGPPEPAPVTFVSVMRLVGRKRPIALLEAFDWVRSTLGVDLPVRLVVVGDGPLGSRMRSEVAARSLGDCVTLTGALAREEIRALFQLADVYVAPAYQESFGIAALEARAAGLPVVAMRSGGVGEFVTDEVEGMLCADDESMAAALATLARDPRLRRRIAAYNARVAPDHDWQRALAAFDDVYARARGAHRLSWADARTRRE